MLSISETERERKDWYKPIESLEDIFPELGNIARTVDSISESMEYGENLYRELIEEGDFEAAKRVDKAFLDTRLVNPKSVKIKRPTTEYISQWPISYGESKDLLQNSHMKEIYERAAYHPELYKKPTHSELLLMIMCIGDHGPLRLEETEAAMLLAIKLGLPIDQNESELHPDAERFVEDLMRKAEVKGRDKPSGSEELTKRISQRTPIFDLL